MKENEQKRNPKTLMNKGRGVDVSKTFFVSKIFSYTKVIMYFENTWNNR